MTCHRPPLLEKPPGKWECCNCSSDSGPPRSLPTSNGMSTMNNSQTMIQPQQTNKTVKERDDETARFVFTLIYTYLGLLGNILIKTIVAGGILPHTAGNFDEGITPRKFLMWEMRENVCFCGCTITSKANINIFGNVFSIYVLNCRAFDH